MAQIEFKLDIQIPELWDGTFSKDKWNSINFIVGANGTGKSMLASKLNEKLKGNDLKVRWLTAERMAGFEKINYNYFTNSQINEGLNINRFKELKSFGTQYGLSTSAFITLKENLELKIKIEALLSDLFHKTIRLTEEGGYLKPKMQDINGGTEYSLKEKECHGLKEIITLLTFLYDKTNNCLILDEPELHLHPQFQSFFLNEIRKVAGNPFEDSTKKIVFIITHSPYFLDIRSIEDFKHVIVCHNHSVPTFLKDNDLDQQDEYVIKKFLPRFNTHHKQFFFSPNPVFVEGYTDQQIISLLFEKTNMNIAATGSSVIDVGGKDELAVFFKLCKVLKIDCRIIADYDAFFRGKLREYFTSSENLKEEFVKKGFGFDISKCVGEIERALIDIADAINAIAIANSNIIRIKEILSELYKEKGTNIEKIKDVVILSLYRYKPELVECLPDKKFLIESTVYKHKQYIECIKAIKIYIIPNGELEHFFKKASVDYFNITRKDKVFAAEFEYILSITDAKKIDNEYRDILPLLKESVPHVHVDLIKHVRFAIIDWIQKVQNAVVRGEVKDVVSLRNNARVEYSMYNQILECRDEDFQLQQNGEFHCVVYLKPSFIGEEKKIEFSDKTTARDFVL